MHQRADVSMLWQPPPLPPTRTAPAVICNADPAYAFPVPLLSFSSLQTMAKVGHYRHAQALFTSASCSTQGMERSVRNLVVLHQLVQAHACVATHVMHSVLANRAFLQQACAVLCCSRHLAPPASIPMPAMALGLLVEECRQGNAATRLRPGRCCHGQRSACRAWPRCTRRRRGGGLWGVLTTFRKSGSGNSCSGILCPQALDLCLLAVLQLPLRAKVAIPASGAIQAARVLEEPSARLAHGLPSGVSHTMHLRAHGRGLHDRLTLHNGCLLHLCCGHQGLLL